MWTVTIVSMCGLFGLVGRGARHPKEFSTLVRGARRRGVDSSGVVFFDGNRYRVSRTDYDISRLVRGQGLGCVEFVAGHSRLITDGENDNQPVVRDGVSALHNGIITNYQDLWGRVGKIRQQQIDSEILPAMVSELVDGGLGFAEAVNETLRQCVGAVAAVIVFPALGKLALASNTGSLYTGCKASTLFFASEAFPLRRIGCEDITQVFDAQLHDIPRSSLEFEVTDVSVHRRRFIAPLVPKSESEEKLLEYSQVSLRRCSRCVLPESMPFIDFGKDGVCNYCQNYRSRNAPKDPDELRALLEPYLKAIGRDCLMPFSGGRDSSVGLHLAVEEFGIKPIAFTYDWGMVTDLGRRNISRMCSALGVENITVAADISLKRANIRKNLLAWLSAPHLGMLNLLTAGDKHFFRFIRKLVNETGIKLNLWSVNPLEVTHFKAGFLGIAPDFEEDKVYRSGLTKQLAYQRQRFREIVRNPKYLNSSLFDTLRGEFYRSRKQEQGYFHLFDYWRWDEAESHQILDHYDWERAPDTSATWRIGDGSAAFYNYVYHRVAGLSEHDTFRSNQIREGDLTRAEALSLVHEENKPRYQNIRWYLDVLSLDFDEVINRVNSMPRIQPG